MLEVDRLAKSFPTAEAPVCVLDGVSLRIAPGGRMAIMGPSGSGKSTLLAILGTLDEPTAGSVRLDGSDPFALSAVERAAFRNRAIGFVFQEHPTHGHASAGPAESAIALVTGLFTDAEALPRGQNWKVPPGRASHLSLAAAAHVRSPKRTQRRL